MISLSTFQLREIERKDNFVDYDIYKDNHKIGILQIVEHLDHIFIRQIHIYKDFQRNGFGNKFMEEYLAFVKQNITLTISTHSISAKPFWMKFFKTHLYNYIKGDTYELIYKKQ